MLVFLAAVCLGHQYKPLSESWAILPIQYDVPRYEGALKSASEALLGSLGVEASKFNPPIKVAMQLSTGNRLSLYGDSEELTRLSPTLGTYLILVSRVVDLKINRNSRSTGGSAEVEMSLFDARQGYVDAVRSKASVRTNPTVNDEGIAIDVIESAAFKDVDKLRRRSHPVGAVIKLMVALAEISGGYQEGFRVGQEVNFMRGEDTFAPGKVRKVFRHTAIILITRQFHPVTLGNKVVVVYPPPDNFFSARR